MDTEQLDKENLPPPPPSSTLACTLVHEEIPSLEECEELLARNSMGELTGDILTGEFSEMLGIKPGEKLGEERMILGDITTLVLLETCAMDDKAGKVQGSEVEAACTPSDRVARKTKKKKVYLSPIKLYMDI